MLSVPAEAGVTFAAYEGANSVQIGVGGTKVSKHAIDYWTTGTPARRYQILGIVTHTIDDAAENAIFGGGNTVGNRKVAKLVKRVGGDAIVMQTDDGPRTHALVIKYVD
jgi:hypothetical protein